MATLEERLKEQENHIRDSKIQLAQSLGIPIDPLPSFEEINKALSQSFMLYPVNAKLRLCRDISTSNTLVPRFMVKDMGEVAYNSLITDTPNLYNQVINKYKGTSDGYFTWVLAQKYTAPYNNYTCRGIALFEVAKYGEDSEIKKTIGGSPILQGWPWNNGIYQYEFSTKINNRAQYPTTKLLWTPRPWTTSFPVNSLTGTSLVGPILVPTFQKDISSTSIIRMEYMIEGQTTWTNGLFGYGSGLDGYDDESHLGYMKLYPDMEYFKESYIEGLTFSVTFYRRKFDKKTQQLTQDKGRDLLV